MLTLSGQFPMSEYVKDPTAPEGWKTISYDGKKRRGDMGDTDNLNADAMEEGCDDGMSDVEPDEA